VTTLGLPFSKVAILSPIHTFSNPHNLQLDRQMLAELRAWRAQALHRGADALYARVQGVPAAAALLQALLDMDAQVLAPAGMHAPGLHPCAWHFSTADFQRWGGAPWPPHGLRGLSCHGIADVERAAREGFDYAFLSPIFPTASHPEATPLGLDVLAEACQRAQLPIIALGGVGLGNADACLQAGAAGWAGIRSWL
jgi:8-oxo-dGTP diphosphatase